MRSCNESAFLKVLSSLLLRSDRIRSMISARLQRLVRYHAHLEEGLRKMLQGWQGALQSNQFPILVSLVLMFFPYTLGMRSITFTGDFPPSFVGGYFAGCAGGCAACCGVREFISDESPWRGPFSAVSRKIPSGKVKRSQFDEICLFVHSRLLNSFSL